MSDARQVTEAVVLRDGERVGSLSRKPHGCEFRYDDGFFLAHRELPGGIATTLPYAQQRFEHHRDNLPPFFAGLLPEGERLATLLSHTKTSPDDLLSLLLAAGTDTIGDIALTHSSLTPKTRPKTDQRPWSEVRFRDLWRASLASESGDEAVLSGVQEKFSPQGLTFPIRGINKRDLSLLKLAPLHRPTQVANEAFFLAAAKKCRVPTAENWLVKDGDNEPGLLVKRLDRQWSREKKRHLRLHQEDLCQLLGRFPADKYRLGCSEIFQALSICAAPIPARLRLLELVAFSYLIGNGDLHGKNVSVLQTDAGLALSPAYDLLSTLPYGDRKLALEFNGRTDDLSANDFVEVGERFGVAEPAVRSMLDRLVTKLAPFEARVGEIGLDERQTTDLARTMAKRRADLG